MHIEINAGGLGAGIAVAEYQLNMSGFISDAEDVISCFEENGFQIVERVEENGWCALAVMKA